MAMALILLADRLSTEIIFKEETPLVIEDVNDFLSNSKEVDISERAYEFVINLVGVNYIRFMLENKGDVWGEIKDGYIYINKNVLVKEMKNEGFEFDAVKSKWFEKGYLAKNSQGYFAHQTRCLGAKASYIKIKESVSNE